MLDFDRINNARPKEVGVAVMAIADASQHHRREARAVAAAAYFLLACEAHGAEPQDVFTAAGNLLVEARGSCPEMDAARMFVRHET